MTSFHLRLEQGQQRSAGVQPGSRLALLPEEAVYIHPTAVHGLAKGEADSRSNVTAKEQASYTAAHVSVGARVCGDPWR